jgi:hypothetical protein
MYVVKFPVILSLTTKMPTGVDFTRIWTPVWILTSHWIVLTRSIERETQIDSLVQNFTDAFLEARSLSVLLVRPNRYCLTLTPELKLRISRKNALRRIAQSTKNTGQIREFEIHNRLVRYMCVELGNRAFGGNIATGPQILLELHENC